MPEELPNFLEPGGTEVATAAGGARKYRKPLLSFCWCDLVSMFTASFSEWSRHKAPRLGASLAFYTLLSIAPLLLVLVSVVSLVLGVWQKYSIAFIKLDLLSAVPEVPPWVPWK